MAKYSCGFNATEKTTLTDKQIKEQLLQLLQKHELLDWLLTKELKPCGESGDIDVEIEFRSISNDITDVLFWVDIRSSDGMFREYYLNGKMQYAGVIFTEPLIDSWS